MNLNWHIDRTVLVAISVLCCASASAQSVLAPQRIQSPIKDAGVYHVASGTWTRSSPGSAFSSDTLYCNKAPSGYFFAGMDTSWQTIDAARIPSTGSPAPNTGSADRYVVDCFQVAYCTLHVGANTDMTWRFFDMYAPCSDLDNVHNPAVTLMSMRAAGVLPGSSISGVQSCWTVALDLSNTSFEFEINGDGDGVWDNDPQLDTFGWSTQVNNNSLSTSGMVGDGPIIAGQCPSQLPPAGEGTVFNPGSGGQGDPNCTGLGTGDQFWIDGSTAIPTNGACFFFGGCSLNPYASFWMEINGRELELGTNFCVGSVNSSGASAAISGAGSDVLADQDLTLTATGLPPGATGIFFFGPMALAGSASLGNGALCAGGMTSRVQPPAMAPMGVTSVSRAFDFAAGYASNPSIAVGLSPSFQFWFRDPMGGGALSNSTNGWQITWQ